MQSADNLANLVDSTTGPLNPAREEPRESQSGDNTNTGLPSATHNCSQSSLSGDSSALSGECSIISNTSSNTTTSSGRGGNSSSLTSSNSIVIHTSSAHSSLTSGEYLSINEDSPTASTVNNSSTSIRVLESNSSSSPRPGSPVPIPAPRRKRKQKRDDTLSLRGSFRARKKGNTTILEELEEKVRELEESTAKKEEELRLADSEACELTSRLEASQEIAAKKVFMCENMSRELSFNGETLHAFDMFLCY